MTNFLARPIHFTKDDNAQTIVKACLHAIHVRLSGPTQCHWKFSTLTSACSAHINLWHFMFRIEVASASQRTSSYGYYSINWKRNKWRTCFECTLRTSSEFPGFIQFMPTCIYTIFKLPRGRLVWRRSALFIKYIFFSTNVSLCHIIYTHDVHK